MPPVTLSAISNATTKVRWREPYASEGLNRKMAVVIPPGVYRGLVLGVSSSNLSVDLVPDPAGGDHVAVQESATGFSVTYTDDTSGTITLPLTAFATNDVVVVCLFVNYSTGSNTTADFRGYELSEFNALSAAVRNALVVLGTVLRPAAGIIPAGNITHDRRKLAFLQRTDESTPWNPLLRNGGFEMGHTNATYANASPFWTTNSSNANFTIRPVSTEAHSGEKSLEVTTSVAGAVTVTLTQDLYMPVVPGRLMMGRLYKKAIQAATLSSAKIRFTFGDLNGTNDTTQDILFAINAVDGSFAEASGIIQVAAGARVLKSVSVIMAGTYAGTGPCIRIDDVQAWAQVEAGNWLDAMEARTAEGAFGRLFLGPTNSFSTNSAKLSFSGTILEIERQDGNLSAVPPAISIPARVAGGIEYTLLFQSIPPGGQAFRKYMSSTGQMVDVINASYDNTADLWTKDVNGQPALKYEIRGSGFSAFSRVSDTSWADAAWVQHVESNYPEITTLANPKFAPLLATRDSAGNRRVALDHLGHRGGRVLELVQSWLAPQLAAWSLSTSGTGAASTIYSDPNIPGPARRLFVNANADQVSNYGYFVVQGPLAAGQLHVVEYELNAADLIGTPTLTFACGFMHDETADPSTEDHVKFYKTSANANWQFLSSGTTQQSTNTGVPPTSFQRFRIELYGSGYPGGARALGYINGALVAEHTTVTALPSNDLASIVFLFKATGVLTNKQVIVSPVRYWGRRYLADDAL